MRLKQVTNKRERGATLVETALMFPFFMFGVLFLIWLGVTLNARSTVTSAVGNGTRLALSRGQANIVGVRSGSLLEAVEASRTGTFNSISPQLLPLLHHGSAVSPFGAGGWYMQEWQKAFGINSASQVPAHYIMALALAYESLLHGIGDSLNFPCDPRGSGPNDGPGCARCANLNPMSSADIVPGPQGRCRPGQVWTAPGPGPGVGTCAGGVDPTVASLQFPNPGGGAAPYKFQWVGVECEYMPSNVVLTPLINMLNMIAPSSIQPIFVFVRRDSFSGPDVNSERQLI